MNHASLTADHKLGGRSKRDINSASLLEGTVMSNVSVGNTLAKSKLLMAFLKGIYPLGVIHNLL